LVGSTDISAAIADATATTTTTTTTYTHTHTHAKHTKHTMKTLAFRAEFSEDLYLTAHNTHRRQISKPRRNFNTKYQEASSRRPIS